MNTQSLLIERQSVPLETLVKSNPVKIDKKLATQLDEQSGTVYFLSDFYCPDLRYACSNCGSLDVMMQHSGTTLHEKCLDCKHEWLEEIQN